MASFTEENVAKNMDNIRDCWNEVNGKSLLVDKQTFIEQITPYCMHKWSFKEWMWCRFLTLSNSILGVLGGNIACYCYYIASANSHSTQIVWDRRDHWLAASWTGQTVFTIFCFQKMFKITKLVPKCFILSVEHY